MAPRLHLLLELTSSSSPRAWCPLTVWGLHPTIFDNTNPQDRALRSLTILLHIRSKPCQQTGRESEAPRCTDPSPPHPCPGECPLSWCTPSPHLLLQNAVSSSSPFLTFTFCVDFGHSPHLKSKSFIEKKSSSS